MNTLSAKDERAGLLERVSTEERRNGQRGDQKQRA
jgi:hypothetical protein